MDNNNEMILVDREEVELYAEQDITDDQWQMIKEHIATDDNMWQVIDECIRHTVDQVIING
jgi:acetone carboxylase gamma subunit